MDVVLPPGVHAPSPSTNAALQGANRGSRKARQKDVFAGDGSTEKKYGSSSKHVQHRSVVAFTPGNESVLGAVWNRSDGSYGERNPNNDNASPASVEISAISPGQWEREWEARMALEKLQPPFVVQEVDSPSIPPDPESSSRRSKSGAVGKQDDDDDDDDDEKQNLHGHPFQSEITDSILPQGLVSELNEIQSASERLLKNMEKIEQEASSLRKEPAPAVRLSTSVAPKRKPKVVGASEKSEKQRLSRIPKPKFYPKLETKRFSSKDIQKRERMRTTSWEPANSKVKPQSAIAPRNRGMQTEADPTRQHEKTGTKQKRRINRREKRIQTTTESKGKGSAVENKTSRKRIYGRGVQTETRQNRAKTTTGHSSFSKRENIENIPPQKGPRNATSNTTPRPMSSKSNETTKKQDSMYQRFEKDLTADEKLRLEMNVMKSDLEKLRLVSVVRSDLAAASSEASSLLSQFPTITESLSKMEQDTNIATTHLQNRIQTLVQSYHDMNKMAANAPVGFLSAVDPYGTLKSKKGRPEKDAEWLPCLEKKFDHQLLHAEADQILEQKLGIDAMLEKVHFADFEASDFGSGKEVAASVSSRIKDLDAQISDYVEQSYSYHKRKDKRSAGNARRNFESSPDPDSYLAPWMVPSKWKMQSSSKAPLKHPPMPKVLRAAFERQQEEMVRLQKLEQEWKARNDHVPLERPRYEAPLKTDTSTKPKPKPKPKPRPKRPSGNSTHRISDNGQAVEEKLSDKIKNKNKNQQTNDENSVDSIEDLLARLEVRREEQETFEASEVAKAKHSRSTTTLQEPEKPTVTAKDDDNISQDFSAVENESQQEQHIEPPLTETDFFKMKIFRRAKNLVNSAGRPSQIALECAYKACHSIWCQHDEFDMMELVSTCIRACWATYCTAFHGHKIKLLRVVTEELIKGKMNGIINQKEMSQFLVLLDCDPFVDSEAFLNPALLIATVIVAICSCEKGQISIHAQNALVSYWSSEKKSTSTLFLSPLEKCSQDADILNVIINTSQAIHGTMIGGDVYQRNLAAIQAVESTISSHKGKIPDSIFQATIQALSSFWSNCVEFGELQLSSLHSSVCQVFKEKGRQCTSIEQTGIRTSMALVVESLKRVEDEDKRFCATNMDASRAVHHSDHFPEKVNNDLLQRVQKVLSSKSPNSELSKSITDLVCEQGSIYASVLCYLDDMFKAEHRLNGDMNIPNHVVARIVVESCVKQVERSIQARAREPSRIDLMRFIRLGANEIGLALDKIDSAVPGLAADDTDYSKKLLREEVVSGHVIQGVKEQTLTGVNPSKPEPLHSLEPERNLVPTEEQVVDYLSSAVLAEMIVHKHNTELTSKPQSLEEDPSGFRTDATLISGGVVQWFVDKGSDVDEDLVASISVEKISEEIQNVDYIDKQESAEKWTSIENPWSDDNILDMITQLYLQNRLEENLVQVEQESVVEREPATESKEAKPEQKVVSTVEQSQLAFEAEQAAAAALASRLAVESTERSMVMREEILRQKEQDLLEKERSAEKTILDAEIKVNQAKIDAKEDQLVRFEAQISSRESQQVALEKVRFEQFQSTLDKVAEMQVSSFSMAMDKLKDIIEPLASKVDKPSHGIVTEVATVSLAQESVPKVVEKVSLSTQTDEEVLVVHDVQEVDDSEEKMDETKVEREEKVQEESKVGGEGEEKVDHDDDDDDGVEIEENNKTDAPVTLLIPSVVLGKGETENMESQTHDGVKTTMLNWSDSDSDSSVSGASDISADLSEGQLDVEPGDLSDGEEVPLELAFQAILKPSGVPALPWEMGEGPNPKFVQKLVFGHEVVDEDESATTDDDNEESTDEEEEEEEEGEGEGESPESDEDVIVSD